MDGSHTGEGVQFTRDALAEIPLRLGRLLVAPAPLQARLTVHQRSHAPLQPLALYAVPAAPQQRLPNLLNPAHSPDELVIQQRGRKHLPVTWSPDIELNRSSAYNSINHTPPKAMAGRPSPPKFDITLRSTPRKLIAFTPEKNDFTNISTPEKFKLVSPIKGTPPIKRPRFEKTLDAEFKGTIDSALKSLSPTQLIAMIKTITHKHPEIENEIKREMPAPDLAPLEERLRYLKSNIFKSLPTSRLTSKTDSLAYSRVATHVAAFKKCLVEQGKILVESQQWGSVLQYVFLAWRYVRATPVWDNQPHNAQRKQCFGALTNFCMTALRKSRLELEELMEVQDRLQVMVADSEELHLCLKYIQGQVNSLT